VTPTLLRRIVAVVLGTAFLVAAVIGSGIMGERLAAGNVAIALLANTIATCAALIALILAFGPISGAHFNPAVTLAAALEYGLSWADAACYVCAQCVGGVAGAVMAHAMFSLPVVSLSHHVRGGFAQMFSEFVATFGLLSIIWGCSRSRSRSDAGALLSDTFAGIRPADVPSFVIAQAFGAVAATLLFRWLVPNLPSQAQQVLLRRNS
jgi:glycerol uptake facilitator-like aquaporin